MTILITGGAGFVGSSVAIYLKTNYPQYRIIVFDNLKRRGSEFNLQELRLHSIDFLHGDIRNPEDFNCIGDIDFLIEASAEPSVLAGLSSDPTYVINNNLYGSVNCFNFCIRKKAHLIFLSTSRVYPVSRLENINYKETDTRFELSEMQTESGITSNGVSEKLNLEGSRSFYGSTKLSSELFISEYETFFGLKAAITRFGVIAGPRQMGKTDQGIVTLWMARHFWNQPLQYIGYGGLGKQVRDILHIDDACVLIDMQLHNIEQYSGKVFNAGGGVANSLSLLEMTNICQTITNNKIRISAETTSRPADLRIYITDFSKLQTLVNWKPQKSVQTIFKDVYDWINKNQHSLYPIFNSN